MTTILVADDAAFVRLWCTRMLGRHGFEVVEASDGKDAVAKYRDHRPDAVLLDVAMPELDGLDALRAIRAFDPTARVAMLTGLGQRHIVLEALNAGARDFVVKPFKPERVLSAVRKLLGNEETSPAKVDGKV
jgi:two-component system, chemotaxis family, chemotaxis protein CheY